MRKSSWSLACCLVLVAVGSSSREVNAVAPPRSDDLSTQALAVLRNHCAGCHGSDARAKGGFGYVLDRDRLVSRGQVVAGQAAESPLWQRMEQGEMPPASKPRLSSTELALLKTWINAGAPIARPLAPVAPANESEVLGLIAADVQQLAPRTRRFVRYLTLSHLIATGANSAEVDMHRQALAKLVNSLSWHPRLTAPQAIDPARTIYRVDLRWYRWSARVWDRLTVRYPYRPTEPGEASRNLASIVGCEQPLVRGDWFVATASRPPVYHDFLQLPSTDKGLERSLQIDTRANIEDDDVLRSGFNGSGVARNNRLLERHDGPHGAYWRSYDFSDNIGKQNLFERPLGPAPGPQGFVQAGGEVIFHLPNGLLGFLLVDGDGRRVDKAPGDIVSDPKRPDKLVENGVSCLSCHFSGFIPKDDQVRPHVLKNQSAFPKEAREGVLALYPPSARFKARMEEDNKRFRAALESLAILPTEPEPVSTAVLRFEGVLDLRTAAAELGVKPDELTARLKEDPERNRVLGPLLARGTVQRQVFEDAYPTLVKLLAPAVSPPPLAGEFKGHRGPIRAAAWEAGVIVTGSEDSTVRVWNPSKGTERLVLEGHRGEVEAIALARDGKRLLSAGQDRIVRLWDISSGKLVRQLVGHTDTVRALAITPDGRTALSAGADRTIRVWDLERGTELAALTGHAGPINALAVSSDGSKALSGGNDRLVILWDLVKKRDVIRCVGHEGAVQTVAFTPGGNAISGSSDRTVREWDLKSGKVVFGFAGHPNTVVAVQFVASSALGGIMTVCRADRQEQAVRHWDRLTPSKETLRDKQLAVANLGGKVDLAVFSPDGRSVLLITDAQMRPLAVPWGR